MKLCIAEQYEKGFVEDTCNLKTSMLQMKSTHLFIASNAWESITIDVNDEIPAGSLKCIPMACSNIKVQLPETVTDKTIVLLTELYPDLAGKLRRYFMMGRSIKEVLECRLVQ